MEGGASEGWAVFPVVPSPLCGAHGDLETLPGASAAPGPLTGAVLREVLEPGIGSSRVSSTSSPGSGRGLGPLRVRRKGRMWAGGAHGATASVFMSDRAHLPEKSGPPRSASGPFCPSEHRARGG